VTYIRRQGFIENYPMRFEQKLQPLIYFAILVAIASCHRKTKGDLLIGNWRMVVDSMNSEPVSSFNRSSRGLVYEFINDSIVDTKRPYYKIIMSKNEYRKYKFIGTTTKYQILNDSIKLFNPTNSVWEKGKYLKKVTRDSLILVNSNGQEFVFFRRVFEGMDAKNFNEIALSSSGCFGTCPIMNIVVDSTGSVIFYGERYLDKLGFFEGKISIETFNKIKGEFKNASIEKLEQNYSVNWTDDQTISTTFVLNNEFVNSIQDYGEAGPAELVWAYASLRYLFESLELKRLDSTKVPFYLDLHYFRFEKENQVCDLTQSESFLLWNYLRKGTLVETKAPSKYRIGFIRNYTWAPHFDEMDDPYNKRAEEQVRGITTDGQFYTFDILGQREVTIDIGFNFFDRNRKFLSFREKGKYD
jgi:hypothetical protein